MLLFGFSVFIINLYEPDFTVRKTRSVLYAASLQKFLENIVEAMKRIKETLARLR